MTGLGRILACLILLSACAEEEEGPLLAEAGTLLADPSLALPDTLAELGLFPQAPLLGVAPVEAQPYAPQWPLWSNGLGKLRHVRLPEGDVVDTAAGDDWTFPVHTLFFKTFTTTDADHPEGQRPVETRIIRVTSDGVEYAAYIWNDAATDGMRSDLKLPVAIAVTEDGESFEHAVPNKLQCRKCHESHPNEILGFVARQLDGETASVLVEAGVFDSSPALETIAHEDEETRAVLGYFQGNCVACHNGSDGPSSSFDLGAEVALEAIIDKPTEGSASAPGIRVIPGDPEGSILYQGMVNTSGPDDDDDDEEAGEEAKAMPPVGVQRKDAQAIERIRAWILALGGA
jgi:hypothetical protein